MRLAEAEAAARGLGYVYLWTRVPEFYAGLGYREARAVPLRRGSAAKLPEPAVLALEAALLKRLPPAPPEREDGDVWMRRRMLDRCADGAADVPAAALAAALGGGAVAAGVSAFPWERQVGPSCGCAAVTMAAAALAAAAAPEIAGVGFEAAPADAAPQAGALAAALALGSTDGELFDARDLARVAAARGLRGAVAAAATADAWRAAIAASLAAGAVVAFAYDRGEASDGYAPVKRRGHRAHYAVAVGIHGDAVACLHGLSRRPLVATCAELQASNAQIAEVDPDEAAWAAAAELNLADRLVVLSRPRPACARVALSVRKAGGLLFPSKVVLRWSFELGGAARAVALTASLRKKTREIEVDGEALSRGDGAAFRDDRASRFSWTRHGHRFALEERLDLPKGAEAARRFRLSVDDVPFDVGAGGCVATVRGKRRTRGL